MSDQVVESKDSKSKKNDDSKGRLAGPIAESLFVILPLVVLSIVGLYQNKSLISIVSSPEWAFGSAVFFGQVIVKLVQAIAISHNLKRYTIIGERIVLIVAILIVFGLIPSLLVLAIMLISEEPSSLFTTLQMIMFAVGLASFLMAGGLVKDMENEKYEMMKKVE